MHVLLVEYVGKLILLPLFAYFIRDWCTLVIAGAAPGLLQIFSGGFYQNHPVGFWYISSSKTQWKSLQRWPRCTEETQRQGDFRDLFSSKEMTKRTLISCFAWLVISLVYYAVSFSSGTYDGNRYLVFFLTSLIEIPSNWTCILLCHRICRKKTNVLGVVVPFIASVIAVLFQRDLKNKAFMVANIIMTQGFAEIFILAFFAIYMYSSELFPTIVRALAWKALPLRLASDQCPRLMLFGWSVCTFCCRCCRLCWPVISAARDKRYANS